MSNTVLLLQQHLKNIPGYEKLFSHAKFVEILYFINSITSGGIDISTYKIYFNKKCLPTYKATAIEQVVDEMEKMVSPSEINVYKIINFINDAVKNNTLKTDLESLVDLDKVLNRYSVYTKLTKKMDLEKEMKGDKESTSQKIEEIKSSLLDSVVKTLGSVVMTHDILINLMASDEKVKLVIGFLMQKVNFKKMKINSMTYLNFLVSLITKGEETSFTALLEKDFSDLFGEELVFYLMHYKYIQEVSFDYFMNFLIDLDEREMLEIDLLREISEASFESEVFNDEYFNNKTKFLLHIFMNILDSCVLPTNQKYLSFMKTLYLENKMEADYNKILAQSSVFDDLLNTPKLLLTNSIIFMKTNKPIGDILNNLLESFVSNEITKTEYRTLVEEIRVIHSIRTKENIKEEILTQLINDTLSRDINRMNSIMMGDPKEMKKTSHKYTADMEYIKNQYEIYQIERRTPSNIIVIQAPKLRGDLLDGTKYEKTIFNIFTLYKKWIDISEETSKYIHLNIKSEIDIIFQNILAKILVHYLKAIQYFMDSGSDNYKNLFYFQDKDDKIKVECENTLEEIFLYIYKQSSKQNIKTKELDFYKFMFDKYQSFINSYKFYSIVHEQDIVLKDIISQHPVVIASMNAVTNNLSRLFSITNRTILTTESLSYVTKMKETNKQMEEYINVEAMNNKYHILSKSEMEVLAIIMDDLKRYLVDLTMNKMYTIRTMISGFSKQHTFDVTKEYISKIEAKNIKDMATRDIIDSIEIHKTGPTRKVVQKVVVDTKFVEYVGKTFEKNEMNYIEINSMKKFITSDDIKMEYDEMISKLSISSINYLNSVFKRDDKLADAVKKLLMKNDLKLNSIAKKVNMKFRNSEVYNIKKNKNVIINDMVKMISILMYLDNIITSSEEEIDFQKILNEAFLNRQDSPKLINKRVLILKGPYKNAFGSVTEMMPNSKDKYLVRLKSEDVIMVDVSNIVPVDDLKAKIVKITRGMFKGQYGVISEFKTFVNTKEESKARTNHIEYLKHLISSYQTAIDIMIVSSSRKQLVIGDQTEMDKITEYKTVGMSDQEQYIRLKEYRFEKIVLYKSNIQNLKNELVLFVKSLRSKGNMVNIMVRYGQKDQRYILLDRSGVKFDVDEITREQTIKKIANIVQNKLISFDNLYQMVKFLFNSMDRYPSDLEFFKYYQMLNEHAIDIINKNKIMKYNNLDRIDFLDKKLKEQTIMYKKLIQNKKKNLDKILKVKKNISKLKESINLKKIQMKDVKILKDASYTRKYTDDLELDDGKKYFTFKINTTEAIKDLTQKTSDEKEYKEKLEQEYEKTKEDLFEDAQNKVEYFIQTLNMKNGICDITSIFKEEIEDVTEEDDGDEELELDVADIESLFDDESEEEKEEEKSSNQDFKVPSIMTIISESGSIKWHLNEWKKWESGNLVKLTSSSNLQFQAMRVGDIKISNDGKTMKIKLLLLHKPTKSEIDIFAERFNYLTPAPSVFFHYIDNGIAGTVELTEVFDSAEGGHEYYKLEATRKDNIDIDYTNSKLRKYTGTVEQYEKDNYQSIYKKITGEL